MYQYFYNCIPSKPNQSNSFPQNCPSSTRTRNVTPYNNGIALSPHHVLDTDARVGIIHDLW